MVHTLHVHARTYEFQEDLKNFMLTERNNTLWGVKMK